MEKTKAGFFDKITRAVAGKDKVGEEFLDELEMILVSSDVGIETTIKIIDRFEARVKRDTFLNASELHELLRDEIVQVLAEQNDIDYEDYVLPESEDGVPAIILVVGVNGVGENYHHWQNCPSVHSKRDIKSYWGQQIPSGPQPLISLKFGRTV